MEKGAKAGSGFSISDKKSSSNSDDVSLMKLHGTEAFPSKIRMMGIHHQEHIMDRAFGGGGGGGVGGSDGGGGGGGVGPTGSNSGGAKEVVGNIYRDDVSYSCVFGENFARSSSTNSQPFDVFAAAYSTKYPVGMAASVGFPFTSAQWKELERQAMIYKYMISSVPVPPDLLFPLSRNFPAAAMDSSASSLYNMRYSKNGDPEPGRCKRTDGKKWRCSRDVAPHQKYCERHLHRGRPRSRKPVEAKNNGENHKKTRLEEQSPLPNSSTASQQSVDDQPLLLFNAKTDLSISTVPSSYKGTNNRDMGLTMEGAMVAMGGAEQRWQHLMGFANEGSSIYGSSALFHHDYAHNQQPLNMLTYSDFPAPELETPIGFIDAWSIDNVNSSNNGHAAESSSLSRNQGNLSPSLNLSIAMAAGNAIDEEMGKIQMGSGDDHSTSQYSRWLNPVSWEPFARGGPLAEALQPGSVAIIPTSPHDSISTPATTVSSPSGVLHRTLFSHSDSSVCNSPTFAAPPSEASAFQRHN